MKGNDFFQKKVSRPSNPPDELAQNVSKKSPSDELLLHFSSKVQNLTVFSIIYMIRIRFFGRHGIVDNYRTMFEYVEADGHSSNNRCKVVK